MNISNREQFMTARHTLGIVLFDGFEILDVFGPAEMFGMYPETFEIRLVAEQGGEVASAQGPRSVVDHSFSDDIRYDVLLVPGGRGTRREINNQMMLDWLIDRSATARYVTSVCTGSAVLAKAGILDGIRATSNKMSFEWVMSQGPNVKWVHEARWVEDGIFFTSSGVSAGMDMTLAFIDGILGREAAVKAAFRAEYDWHMDPAWDPFAKA
jgi:putative intracellular protease/amidase